MVSFSTLLLTTSAAVAGVIASPGNFTGRAGTVRFKALWIRVYTDFATTGRLLAQLHRNIKRVLLFVVDGRRRDGYVHERAWWRVQVRV